MLCVMFRDLDRGVEIDDQAGGCLEALAQPDILGWIWWSLRWQRGDAEMVVIIHELTLVPCGEATEEMQIAPVVRVKREPSESIPIESPDVALELLDGAQLAVNDGAAPSILDSKLANHEVHDLTVLPKEPIQLFGGTKAFSPPPAEDEPPVSPGMPRTTGHSVRRD